MEIEIKYPRSWAVRHLQSKQLKFSDIWLTLEAVCGQFDDIETRVTVAGLSPNIDEQICCIELGLVLYDFWSKSLLNFGRQALGWMFSDEQ
jgi:hypothetical protein